MSEQRHVIRAPMPSTTIELLALRRMKAKPTINDQVESLFLALYERPEFQRYSDAIYDEQAITGNLALEDGKLAEMIVELAKERGIIEVMNAKLWLVVKVIRVVLRRYGLSRLERRNMSPAEPGLDENDTDNSGK